MQLTNHLDTDQILVGCDETDKERLLERLVRALLSPRIRRLNPEIDVKCLLDAILEREAERPTVMGDGLGFPHARIRGFNGIGMALAILERPINFGDTSSDVRLVCMIVVPQESPMVTLKVMSRIAKFFREPSNRTALLAAPDRASVMALLSSGQLSLDIPVTARDVMLPVGFSVSCKTPLREVTRLMHAQRLSVVAVTSGEGSLIGEITNDGLFQFGLPEFFQHLKSVRFISEFDPFEKYFEREAHSLAEQLMNSNICRITAETTILEIVFELAVKRRSQIYVMDAENKWIGTVDRAAVLNNVINW